MIIGECKITDFIKAKDDWQSKVWFTSDTHFSHQGILKWLPDSRPFDDVEDMNERLVQGWNDNVKDDDVVFMLGDLTLGSDGADWLEKLNGKIYCCYLPYHHDKRWINPHTYWGHLGPEARHLDGRYLVSASGSKIEYFAEGTVMRVPLRADRYKNVAITMSHYPMVEWTGSYHRGFWHLHGHKHGGYFPDESHGFCYDVGYDSNNLEPISLKTLVSIAKDWDDRLDKLEVESAR